MICLHFPCTVPSSMYQTSAASTEQACLAMIREENINPSPPVVLWARRSYDASHHRDAPFTGGRLEENKWYAEIMAAAKSVSPWRSASFDFVDSHQAEGASLGGRCGVTAVAAAVIKPWSKESRPGQHKSSSMGCSHSVFGTNKQ